MKSGERRIEILNLMQASVSPLSATKLAERFGVSRQVIVQDIAVLREKNADIVSTNRGYVFATSAKSERIFKLYHTDEQIAEELDTIVSLGGTVESVFVYHRVYGRIEAKLHLQTRVHVADYVRALSGSSKPLKSVTNGYHYHLISASSAQELDAIERALKEKGFLLTE